MNLQSGTKSNDEILFIQTKLKSLTQISFDEKYIKTFYLPLLQSIKNKRNIMIAGSQGSGKSSLAHLISAYLKKYYSKNSVVISLDDFYLSKNSRVKLSKKIHPLFLTRGVPGTHDIESLLNKFQLLTKKVFPVYLPIFDKVKDTRKRSYKKICKADVIILEGWCVGARPISNQYLYKNINNLETFQDPYFKWRNNYNRYLSSYQKIFSKFNFFIYLQFNDWKSIIEWKYKQELRLRNKKKDLSLKKYLSEFIQYYEKISRWMYIKSPHDCQLLIKIDKDQKIKQIKWPQKVT